MFEFLLFRGVAIFVLILGNGFFVAAEFALVSVRQTRVEQMIAQRRPGARLVRHLQEHLDDFLPAVQLGVTLCSLALGWIGEPVVADVFEVWLGDLPSLACLRASRRRPCGLRLHHLSPGPARRARP